MKRLNYLLVLLAVFLIEAASNVMYAQPPGGLPPGGGGNGSTPPCWDPSCIPVDGGVSLLIAAGVALGGKKIYDSYKKNNQE